MDRVCPILDAAYTALADGYQAHEQHKDLEAALEVLGRAKKGVPPAEAKTALASIVSLIGTDMEDPPLPPELAARKAPSAEEAAQGVATAGGEALGHLGLGLVSTIAVAVIGHLGGRLLRGEVHFDGGRVSIAL
jgi:hypothetical protein